MNKRSFAFSLSLLLAIPITLFSEDENRERGAIEEITVTAEKRTSTVSDTSMSITAFDASLLEDLGLSLIHISEPTRPY